MKIKRIKSRRQERDVGEKAGFAGLESNMADRQKTVMGQSQAGHQPLEVELRSQTHAD